MVSAERQPSNRGLQSDAVTLARLQASNLDVGLGLASSYRMAARTAAVIQATPPGGKPAGGYWGRFFGWFLAAVFAGGVILSGVMGWFW
jgi:hypothetical protein